MLRRQYLGGALSTYKHRQERSSNREALNMSS
jgi:hypothetical protein